MCADDKREGDKGTTEDKSYRFFFLMVELHAYR